jgi:radical SAM protein with 4Fe4S-binding SPASM domain
MLSVSRLLNGTATTADALRYGRHSSSLPSHLLHFAADKKPVVVWNVTRRCNLHCIHCYSSSQDRDYPNELSTDEGRALLDDLAAFGVPTVLFSGGEPLMRDDLFELVAHARERGLRCVLSTNGTRIDPDTARQIAVGGFSYVGISFDGIGGVHDKVRGQPGAYDASLQALRLLRDLGMRVGLRFTVHRKNVDQLPAIFDLLEQEDIDRCCIYHLAYSGRGERIQSMDLAPGQTRAVVEYVFDRAEAFHRRGLDKEILTVDNAADSIMLLHRVRERHPKRAMEVWQMLAWNGGNQSGIAISSIDPIGGVHADQFSWNYRLGNVRHRQFSEIWADESHPRLADLRRKPRPIKGRCSVCRFRGLCNGNLRARAESYFDDFLAPDPACYLTDAEIGIRPGTPQARAAAEWPVPVQSAS